MKQILILLAIFLLTPAAGFAQLGQNTSKATIELSTRFPAPGEVFTAKLNAYSYDTTTATIRWYLNNTEIEEAFNQRSITLTAGSLGKTTKLQAEITFPNGDTVIANNTFTISDIDLIVEADTTTPSFYRGRAVPSIGSNVRVVALPQLNDSKKPENYTYTWRLDDEILGGGAKRGGYIASFIMPTGRGASMVVDVTNAQGVAVASKRILIPSSEPELLFYEDNPLRGTSPISIPKNYQLIGSEVTLRAEPYFMSTVIPTTDKHLEWKINNRTVDNPSEDPQLITLQNAGGSGSFNISFHYRNLKQLLQGVEEQFSVRF